MDLTRKEDRPAFVVFSYMPVEVRDESAEAGCPQYKDVAMATITPIGGRDNVIRVVDDWFKQLAKEVQDGRFPADWLRGYREQFAAWQSGEEMPVSGTPIKTWPVVTPAQVKALLEIQVRTVEDLANLPEEGIMRLGMGGRALKQKAQDYLLAAKDSGKATLELETLRRDNETLVEANKELRGQLTALEAKLDALIAAAANAPAAPKK